MKLRPETAVCAACLKEKQCVTERTMRNGDIRKYDNFQYSEEHRGWLCKKCSKALEKKGGGQRDLVDYMNERGPQA